MSALAALWSLRERRPRFVALAALTLAALLAYPAVDWWLRSAGVAPQFRFWDFGAYGGAVVRWHAGDPLYLRTDDGGFHGSYLYPPVALLLFVPFAALTDPLAQRLAWVTVTTGLLWVGLQRVVTALGGDLAWWERGLFLWAMLGFQPLLLAVKMGQTAPFQAAALSFALVCLLRDDRAGGVASGALTALVGVVKLPYAPAGAHLLRDRTRFAGALLAGGGLVVFSLALFGVETHQTYLDVLRWGFEQGGDARSPALWMEAYFRPLAWLPAPQVGRVLASLAIAGAAVAHAGPDREVFALGVAAVPLLAPLSYTYYLVALLPAAVVLLAGELERGDRGYPTVPVVAVLAAHLHAYGLKFLVDVLPRVVPGWSTLRPVYPLLQPGLWGCALLVGLAAVRVGEHVHVAVPGAKESGG